MPLIAASQDARSSWGASDPPQIAGSSFAVRLHYYHSAKTPESICNIHHCMTSGFKSFLLNFCLANLFTFRKDSNIKPNSCEAWSPSPCEWLMWCQNSACFEAISWISCPSNAMLATRSFARTGWEKRFQQLLRKTSYTSKRSKLKVPLGCWYRH